MSSSFNPAGLPQSVITIGGRWRALREGIKMNVFLGRERYYPPVSDTARWAEMDAGSLVATAFAAGQGG